MALIGLIGKFMIVSAVSIGGYVMFTVGSAFTAITMASRRRNIGEVHSAGSGSAPATLSIQYLVPPKA